MIFLSIREYFYKLNTIGFILLLLPTAGFIFLYYYTIDHAPMMGDEASMQLIMSILFGVCLLDLTIVHWLERARIKKLNANIELVNKMDGYFTLSIVRMAMYCLCCLLMGAGFYLTGSTWFSFAFVFLIVAYILQWPSARRFCRQLRLRKDERDMVVNNLDMPT